MTEITFCKIALS